MMNKSKIEWCDFTWNPVTGCRHGCPYCYAAKQARRFSGDVRLNKSSEQLKRDENGLYILDKPFKNQVGKVIPDPVGFEPIMHKYRLPMPAQKKKPAKIFVVSMGDLFGAWVPDNWIEEVFKACDAAPWHTYMFLTKNPDRYVELAHKGILRDAPNFWYGSTATKSSMKRFVKPKGDAAKYNAFISIEPIQEKWDINPYGDFDATQWVIIGAETGNHKGKVVPEKEWIRDIVKACRTAGTPVFMKDNLISVWGEDLIKEWPAGMPMDKGNDVPQCKECEHCEITSEGKRGNRHHCKKEDKHVPGRYARTSPPWCPLRREEEAADEITDEETDL